MSHEEGTGSNRQAREDLRLVEMDTFLHLFGGLREVAGGARAQAQRRQWPSVARCGRGPCRGQRGQRHHGTRGCAHACGEEGTRRASRRDGRTQSQKWQVSAWYAH